VTVALSIQQSEQYLGNGRWKWSVWLGGTSEELDNVDHVMYNLDSTFHHPVRTVNDRSSNFRLEDATWGAFKLYAIVMHKDGRELGLEHDLVLLSPDSTPTVA
jgi:transcription initiation factor IIF auxiliary subunit